MKNKNTPNLVSILILSLITIIFWIMFGVIRIISSPKEPQVPSEILLPLSPTLNADVLNSIGGKIFYNDDEIGVTTIEIVSPTPEPSPTPSPSPSPTASPEATQESTESATLEQ